MEWLSRLGDSPPLVVLIAALVAGTVRGYTGFGSAMIFMWIIDATMQLVMVRSTWRHARWGEIGPLFIGYVVGLPLGIYTLMTVDPGPIRWVTSLSIMVALAMLLAARRVETSPGLPATVATGAVSGLISGVASLGGMVLSLFWLAGPSRNEAVRGSSVAFFVPASLLSGALLALAGLFTAEAVRIAAWTMVPYGLGIGLGSFLFSRADARLFRPVAFAVIAAAALTSLPALDGWLR